MRSRSLTRGLFVAGLVLPISLLHYLTPHFENLQHLIYREFYLLPIFVASFWFGLRGGIFWSLTITAIYLPSLFIWNTRPEVHLLENVMQMAVFNLFAVTLGVMRDRDRKAQQEQQATAGLAALGRAVSIIAHDLKSPLSAVGGFAVQVRRKLEDGDPSARKLDLIINQAGRMETMVGDMLAFARPLELKTEAVDLWDLLEKVAEVAKAAACNPRRIEISFDQDIPRLQLDSDRIEQAVLNLVNNAVQASPEDSTVHLVCQSQNGRVLIEVRDQGGGIPLEKQNELFTPFVTTKKEGTGLGLPISKKIAEAHGGRLMLTETSSQGTSFVLELPKSRADQASPS